jgi:hypothetical protein
VDGELPGVVYVAATGDDEGVGLEPRGVAVGEAQALANNAMTTTTAAVGRRPVRALRKALFVIDILLDPGRGSAPVAGYD